MNHRFAILHHTHGLRPAHYDLLLQFDTGNTDDDLVLKAFATTLDVLPFNVNQPKPIEATPMLLLPDHRRVYLSYEGPVSKQRGEVTRVDEGFCEVSLKKWPETLMFTIKGKSVCGRYELRRVDEKLYMLEPRSESLAHL